MLGKKKLYGFTIDKFEYSRVEAELDNLLSRTIEPDFTYKTEDEYIFLFEAKEKRDEQYELVNKDIVPSIKKINKPVRIKERFLRLEDV